MMNDIPINKVLKLRKEAVEFDYINTFAKKHNFIYVESEKNINEQNKVTYLISDDETVEFYFDEICFDVDSETSVNSIRNYISYLDYTEYDPIDYITFTLTNDN